MVTGLKQSHVEIKEGSTGWKGIKGASDGFMRTVAESYIFAGTNTSPLLSLDGLTRLIAGLVNRTGTDFQILTLRSGFGKIRKLPPLNSSTSSSLLL